MIPAEHPHIQKLVRHQIAVFPEHEEFLRDRFATVSASGWLFIEEMGEGAADCRRPVGPGVC